MNAEQQGIYRNLLDAVWLFPNHVIPDTQRALEQAAGCSPQEWERSGAFVLRWMKRVTDGWTNETALSVIGASVAFQERQREKGRKRAAGAQRKAGKFQPQDQPDTSRSTSRDASHATSQSTSLPSPSPSPSPITVSDTEKKTRRGSATWLTPFAEIWTAEIGAFDFGKASQPLQLVVAAVGQEEAVRLFGLYCRLADDRTKLSCRHFAACYRAVGNGVRRGRSTAHDNQDAIRRVMSETLAEEQDDKD